MERPTFEEAWRLCETRVVMLMGGMGDDTAMMIAEMFKRGYEPDEIVFCDTGTEFPHTYEFVELLRAWMESNEWSKLTWLRKTDKNGEPLSVIGLCRAQNTLPSAAFGSKTCSLRFKMETADKYFNNHPLCWKAWGIEKKGAPLASYTGKVLRVVGINADEPGRAARWKGDPKYIQVFPLFDWDIGERESDAVEEVGLKYPGKSSCYICPHLTAVELAMLRSDYPNLYQEALDIEEAYIKHNRKPDSTTRGLCRSKTIKEKLAIYDAGQSQFETEPCEACKG